MWKSVRFLLRARIPAFIEGSDKADLSDIIGTVLGRSTHQGYMIMYVKYRTTLVHASLLACLCNSAIAADQQPIEKLTVISHRVETPVREIATSVTTLNLADIQNSVSLNLSEILRTTPSVSVSNSGGLGKSTTLRIRGEEGFRTKLYIDGIEFADPSAPQVAPIFDDLLTSQIQRIEILRGTQGLAYGADAGGVLRIETRQADDGLEANFSAGLSSFDTRQLAASAGFGGQQGDIYFAVTDVSSDGFNAQAADDTDEQDGYENTSLHFKAKLNFSDQLSITAVARNVSANTEYDGCFDNTTFAATNVCVTDSEYTSGRLALDYRVTGQSHTLAVNQSDVQRDFFSNGEFGFANQGEIAQLEYISSYDIGLHQLVLGADLKREKLKQSDQQRKQKGVYAEFLAQLGEKLHVNAGVRYDDNDTFGQHTSYRLGIAQNILLSSQGNLKLKASLGTGFRAPSLFEQGYNDGAFAFGDAAGLQLREENSRGADFGFEYVSSAGLEAELVFFRQSIENEIVFDANSFQGYLQDVGTSRSKGVEMSFNQTLSTSLSVWGNYTYNDAENGSGEARLRRPRHKANLGLRGVFMDDTLTLDFHIRHIRDAVDINFTPLDDYSVSALSASYAVTQTAKIKLGITNIFDKQYQEVIGFNTAGRALYSSIQVDF